MDKPEELLQEITAAGLSDAALPRVQTHLQSIMKRMEQKDAEFGSFESAGQLDLSSLDALLKDFDAGQAAKHKDASSPSPDQKDTPLSTLDSLLEGYKLDSKTDAAVDTEEEVEEESDVHEEEGERDPFGVSFPLKQGEGEAPEKDDLPALPKLRVEYPDTPPAPQTVLEREREAWLQSIDFDTWEEAKATDRLHGFHRERYLSYLSSFIIPIFPVNSALSVLITKSSFGRDARWSMTRGRPRDSPGSGRGGRCNGQWA